MAERVVRVRLTAEVAEYQRRMLDAANATRTVGTEAEKLTQTRQAFNTLGVAGVAMGAALAAGIGTAISAYAQFDAAVSNVIATGEDAARNQDALRQAALDAGAATVFSATESANAIEDLAKAGLSAADILNGGLNGALSLAAAGGLGVAQAAEISAAALTQFGLSGDQASHVADLLAAGAGKAQGDVTDLGAAFSQVGVVASATGLSIEETTAGLAAFASAGLLGSDAGTSFKSMLQALTPNSQKAADEMERLGISAYDSQGQFIGLQKFAGNLQSALADLTDEQRSSTLQTIFGSDAVRAANILYSEGAAGIADWTDKVDDSGYAAKAAAARMDNLAGDVEKLQGSLDTFFIGIGAGADGPLRSLAQGAGNLVDLLSGLPDPLKAVGLSTAVAAAGVGLLGGGALLAVPKIAELKVALSTLNVTSASTKAGLGNLVGFLGGPWGAALTLATVAIGVFIGQQAEMAGGARELQETLEDATGATTDYTREVVARKLAEKGVFDVTTAAGISQREVVDAIVQGGGAMASYREQIRGYINDGHQFDISATNASNAVLDLRTQTERAGQNFRDVKTATQEAADANEASVDPVQSAADAYLEANTQAGGLLDTLHALIDEIDTSNQQNVDAITANANYRESLAGIAGEVERQKAAYEEANGTLDGFNLSLDRNTVSGSANAASLAQVAQDARNAAESQLAVDTNTVGADQATQNYLTTLANQKQAFIDSATQAGYNADEVHALADEIFRTPDAKQTQMIVETAEAEARVQNLKASLSAFQNSNYGVNVTAYVRQVEQKATGGAIYGPGTGTSDSIPARLSNGEHVFTAQDVSRMGGQSGVYAFRRSLYGEGRAVPGYAMGGAVGPAAPADPVMVAMPSSVTVRIGEREFEGYMDERARAVSANSMRDAAAVFKGGRRR